MGLLMGSFVQEMEDLMQGGITWTDGTTFISSQVHPFRCSADAPARAIMQNMRQFNGRFGCGWCLHPGTIVEAPDGVVRAVVHGINAGTPPEELRAHPRVLTQGVKIPQARITDERNRVTSTGPQGRSATCASRWGTVRTFAQHQNCVHADSADWATLKPDILVGLSVRCAGKLTPPVLESGEIV
ncbi:hypothetical protein HPB49_003521 [Dermacentor silvarum]|uniref:Uncharacterized protein n=1 Tax=Dermacentor silvarum TaxID=543639 RepID=A0ACB8DU12_DERSI|nr:hypothetical protein HPB49_003521 [Dermacentor silvarum]